LANVYGNPIQVKALATETNIVFVANFEKIFGLFNSSFNCIDYIASDGRVIVELERKWFLAYFKVLFQ
jgi:hypothetical protein